MMKRLILSVAVFLGLMSLATPVFVPAYAYASTAKDEICKGVETIGGSTGCAGGDASLTKVIRSIINVFSVIIGIVAVIMVMVAGFKYITAGGDSGNISSAKNTLIYAIVGLVVVGLSQTIVAFVLDTVN